MTDEQQEHYQPWETWSAVPDEVKAQLLQGPFPRQGPNLSASDLFYDALRKILAAL